jgi:MOSC domain-containing protein YiiM
MMTVTNLFIKRRHGVPLEPKAMIEFNERGISSNINCAPLRQVLIASQSVTAACGLKPGDLRENIVVDFDGLYELPSGTVVKIGEALLRLTFHCEPCKKILKLVELDRILHKRGVLGSFVNSGKIAIGDKFSVTEQTFEPIPYAVKDRIRWLLKKQDAPSAAIDLVHAIGLPSSCAKVVPKFLQKFLVDGGVVLRSKPSE